MSNKEEMLRYFNSKDKEEIVEGVEIKKSILEQALNYEVKTTAEDYLEKKLSVEEIQEATDLLIDDEYLWEVINETIVEKINYVLNNKEME